MVGPISQFDHDDVSYRFNGKNVNVLLECLFVCY